MTELILTPQQMHALALATAGTNRQEQAMRLGVSRAMLTIYLRDGVTPKCSGPMKAHLIYLAEKYGVI